jgi:uncharacterized membrane protein
MERTKKDTSTSSQESLLVRLKLNEEGDYIGEAHALQVVSPVPPASELKKLSEVLTDGPERVFAMAEKALDHRIELEKSNEKTESYLAQKSIWFAFFLSCLGIICSTILVLNGHSVIGTLLSAGVLVPIIASFLRVVSVKKSSEQPSERERQSPIRHDDEENKSASDASDSSVNSNKSLQDSPPE